MNGTPTSRSTEPLLRLELTCVSANVNPELALAQAQLERLLADQGIDVTVQPTVQDGVAYQDAYVYFRLAQAPLVLAALDTAAIDGDVLDRVDGAGLAAAERALATRELWATE